MSKKIPLFKPHSMIPFEQVFHISTRKRKNNSLTEEDITVKLVAQFNSTVHNKDTNSRMYFTVSICPKTSPSTPYSHSSLPYI